MLAVIVGELDGDFAKQTNERLAPPLDEAGVFVTVGTDRAGTLVPPFLRSLTVASTMCRAIPSTLLRRSNSPGPSNWSSRLVTIDSAILRMSPSIAL
jgi:hypothetical protein